MIYNADLERTTLWCLCGKTYVFNGNYGTRHANELRSQITCACLGEQLAAMNSLVRAMAIDKNTLPRENESISVDSMVHTVIDKAPYSISRKAITSHTSYNRRTNKLEDAYITSGYTIKAVPGQTPQILKWQRGVKDKDTVKTVTYLGGCSLIGADFISQAWMHLKPAGFNGFRVPISGQELIYFLAMPALATEAYTGIEVARITGGVSPRYRHLNPDHHLLRLFVSKGDVYDTTNVKDFVDMVTGTSSSHIQTVARTSVQSWAQIHCMSHFLREAPEILASEIQQGVTSKWSFYDTYLSDRVSSSYMEEIWDYLKWFRSRYTVEELNNYVRADGVTAMIAAMYSRIKTSIPASEYLKSLTINYSLTIKEDIDNALRSAYKIATGTDGMVTMPKKTSIKSEDKRSGTNRVSSKRAVSGSNVSSQARPGTN